MADSGQNKMSIDHRGDDPMGLASNNLSTQAYSALSEAIQSHRLRPGDVVVEAKLAVALGVSRTPLREALQRLEGEGLVAKSANRSFVIRRVDLSEYLQALKVRELVETEAAFVAVGRIPEKSIQAARAHIEKIVAAATFVAEEYGRCDDEVHSLWIDHCGNAVLAKIIKALRATTRHFEFARMVDLARIDSRSESDVTEHLHILDALESREQKRIRQAVQNHLRSLNKSALAVLAP